MCQPKSRTGFPFQALCAAVLALVVTACGGGGGDAATGTSTPPTASTARTLVTADVDGDDRPDLVFLDRTDVEAPRCQQGDGNGGFTARPDWVDHPVVRAIRVDARGRDDDQLRADDGIHEARGVVGGAPHTPYAVLHVGPDSEAPDGPPAIEAINPDTGPAGSWIVIHGTNFLERVADGSQVETTVTVDGIAAEVLYLLPRFVLTTVPTGTALGAVNIVVTRGSGADSTSSTAAPFTVVSAPVPTIEAVHPNPLVRDSLAYVCGIHLGTPLDEVSVSLGGVAVDRFLALGRRLVFEVPTTAAAGPLVVTVNGVASTAFAITVQDDFPNPVIAGLTPAARSPGSLVRIEGTNLFVLGDRVRIYFDGVEAALFSASRDALTVIVPTTAQSGDVTVRVGDRTSAGSAFTVVARGAPTIAILDPSAGNAGSRVTIEGTDLYDLGAWQPGRLPPFRAPFGEVTVRFGNERSFFVTPTVDGLRAVVPFRTAAGVVDVSVQIGTQTSNTAPFTVR